MSKSIISDEEAHNAIINAHCYSPKYIEQFRYLEGAILAAYALDGVNRKIEVTDEMLKAYVKASDSCPCQANPSMLDNCPDCCYKRGIEAALKAQS